MGATIAIHVVVVGLLLLSRTEYFPKVPPTMEVRNIPIDVADPPPPPPLPDQPVPKSNIQPPKVVIARPIDPTTFVVDPIMPDNYPIDVIPSEPVKPVVDPVPVLVEAAIDPRFARDFQPPYPPAKLRMGENGRVVVRVQIGTDGRVRAIELVSATDTIFFEATRRYALRHWRFTPATRDGLPVESWKTMTLRFEMKD